MYEAYFVSSLTAQKTLLTSPMRALHQPRAAETYVPVLANYHCGRSATAQSPRQATTSNQPYGLRNGEDWRKRGRILALNDDALHRSDAGH